MANGWGFGDNTDHAAAAKTQSAADAKRAADHKFAMEYAQTWSDINAAVKKESAAREAAFRDSQRPKPSLEEDMAAVRALLEAQAKGSNNA